MLLPDPDTLNNLPFNRFVLANLAAKRAEQLTKAARPLLNSEEMARLQSHHPLTIALAEIALGKIKPKFAEAKPIEAEPDSPAPISDVIENPTVGTLLSRLSDDDFGLRSLDDLIDDADLDDVTDATADSLDDVDDEKAEDEEDDIIESSEDQISLDDVAEQENAAELDATDDL